MVVRILPTTEISRMTSHDNIFIFKIIVIYAFLIRITQTHHRRMQCPLINLYMFPYSMWIYFFKYGMKFCQIFVIIANFDSKIIHI